MCLESTDEIMAITHAHPCFPADNHFEQSIPWITDVYFGIVTCPASAFVFPISSHLQIPNKSLYLYQCEGWFFGIASFLFIFEGVRYFSGMFPTKTDWPDLWAAAIFENNNCHVSVRSHPINSQLFGMSILTSNLRFIATCFLSISPTATLQNAD